MLFNTAQFAVFFAIVYGLYRLLPHRGQNILLLVAGNVFYGWWDWRFLILIWITIVADFVFARALDRAPTRSVKRRWVLFSVCCNLGLLGFFKYFNFFAESFALLAARFGWQVDPITLRVVLPVGISFYTFQSISYVVEVYRGQLKPIRNFLDYAVFVTYFPQLVAGPINRGTQLLPQITHPRLRRLTPAQLAEGIWLIAWGLFKKAFVADNLARFVDGVFAKSGVFSGAESLLGIYAFALQIYGDFAGYSDMARGLSKLMGIELVMNFRRPYLATNPAEFWANWHISLSTWLRDFLYIPLGGNRRGPLMTYRNLAITMLLGGLWHGAAWTYVLWGAYQGALLIVHRLLQPMLVRHALPEIHPLAPVWRGLKIAFMFQLTCLGWLIFRAHSVAQILQMVRNTLFHFALPGEVSNLLAALAFYSGWFLVVWALSRVVARLPQGARMRVPALGALAGCMAYLLIFHRVATRAFIYFQF